MNWIDPDEFPFSQDEVYLALRLTSSEKLARTEAARIAEMGRDAHVARLAAQQALARGSRDAAEVNRDVLYLSPEFFALLAAVSTELAARVDAYWERIFAQNHELRLRNALRLARVSSLDDPAAADVRATLESADADERALWHAVRSGVEADLRQRAQ